MTTKPAPPEISADPYYKKTVELAVSKRRIKLAIGETLFSTAGVDVGTQLLLRSLLTPNHDFSKILDLGCGYGPIGLMLKAAREESTVHMVDRDALAVHYAQISARLNRLNASVTGSLGYDDVVDRDYDLVTSNIPGKAGLNALRTFLLDAQHHLRPGGLVAVVVVRPLESDVVTILEESEKADIVHTSGNKTYRVVHYTLGESPEDVVPGRGFERGAYDRQTARFSCRKTRYGATTVFGLGEFDSLSFQTRLVAETLGDAKLDVGSAAVYNPGQGHVAVLAGLILGLSSVILADRDLLALRASARALTQNGLRPDLVLHTVLAEAFLPRSVDLYIDSLRPKEPLQAIRERVLKARDARTSRIMLAGTSTVVSRAIEDLKKSASTLRAMERWRTKGFSVVLYENRS